MGSARFIDLVGQRFGRLVVIKRDGVNDPRHNNIMWLCRCDCGTKKRILGQSLRNGDTSTCGCTPRWRRPRVSN